VIILIQTKKMFLILNAFYAPHKFLIVYNVMTLMALLNVKIVISLLKINFYQIINRNVYLYALSMIVFFIKLNFNNLLNKFFFFYFHYLIYEYLFFYRFIF